MSKHTLEQLSSAIDRAKMLGYSIYIYASDNYYSVSLNKTTNGGGRVEVKGDGENFEEAIRKCFSNFPENPLDGTGWKNNRLEAPKAEPIDAEFAEVSKES